MKEDNLAPPVNNSIEQSIGSGARSLAGYDYQVDVSIWLALDLMLGSDLTQMIELEPASEEDLEAELADDEPSRVATSIGIGGYTLVVQVKLRGGDAWTINDINSLLKHGSPTRPSAVQRLENPAVKYLLVTSASTNGKARNLRVKRAGSWPKEGELPPSTAGIVPEKSDGRIAVIDNLDEGRLVDDIKRLLVERFGVPNSRWINCLHVLRHETRLRVRRVHNGQWHRKELANVIRNHDGYLASSPELDRYVHPKNWQDLRDAMGPPKYAAIIIGQSGTGKTHATRKIYEELRREIPGLTRVPIRSGPQQLRDDSTPPPVLYDIEDPWGRYDFDPASRPWNDELAKLMSSAHANAMIIATSRLDVATSSGARESVKQWIVPLEAEQYGKSERQQLYRTRIDTLPRGIQELATSAEKQVLDKLATPLEIDKFFDALRMMERNGYNVISEAIDKAHEQSIEQTVINQIEVRNDISASAVIWALLKTIDRLPIQKLRDLELELAERFSGFEKGIMPLIDFFVAARNLRSGDGLISYYHPRVEAGIESTLKRHNVPTKRALLVFLDVLTDPNEPWVSWGAEVAVRVVAAAKQIPELDFAPKNTTWKQIDSWLSPRLADPSCKLNEYLSLAAAAGSPDSNAAEFARYLLHRKNNNFGNFFFWACPDHPEDWYERLRKDSAIALIASRFIREILPEDRTYYNDKFIDDLDRLAPDLTPDYLATAAAIVRYGYTPSSKIIIAGALRDLVGFEPILDDAIEKLTPSKENQAEADEIHLAIVNEVYNDDYAAYLSDNDDGHTAWEFLKAYADRVRQVMGWESLAQHRHAAHLLPHWMRSFEDSAKTESISVDEIAGAFAAAFDSKEESTLWFVLMQHWDEQYKNRLLTRIRAGSPVNAVRYASLACLIKRTPDALAPLVQELRQAGKDERIVELTVDLAYLQNQKTSYGYKYEVDAAIAMDYLEPELQELCKAARSSDEEKLQPLSEVARTLLAKLVCPSPSVRTLRIHRYLDIPDSVHTDIKWTLANSDDSADCIKALDAAIALDLTEIVAEALNHRFSHVVAKALTSIGERSPTPLPTNLLALADAKGSPVRKALVRLISDKPHPDHLPVLIRLAQDQWSSSSRYYGEHDNFPIARSAVDAITKLEFHETAILEQLQEIALKTTDEMVRKGLFKVIIAQGDHTFQNQLFEFAITPGRINVRHAAAYAMLANINKLDMEIVNKINANHLTKLAPKIAAKLTLIVACRAPVAERIEIARKISAASKRRALLLLMLWPKVNPCESSKSAIKQFLPKEHPSLSWVNAGPTEPAEDDLIADLGNPAICREILRWLNPSPK
ncbi:hypothetical protein LJC19_07700 [Oxalobacter sp. OttesenSCG-928-P03]|nr:hypothetical protein [Oxalobacter sp. OttesenSCG-928-P03]